MTAPRIWGGRFQESPAENLKRFNDSFSCDHVLLNEEIEGSIAWARALAGAGVLSHSEVKKIVQGLVEIRKEGYAKPPDTSAYEDVHSFVEAALGVKVGVLAGKLHSGRSRNDQVATDLKLFLRKALAATREQVLDLASALVRRSFEEAGTPMPGYTHLKQAEPITFGHWCLAYVEMLLRDASRLAGAVKRGDECPLGSGALAGTPLRIDRGRLAQALGFARPTANSLDAVSDRDMAVEFLFAGSLLLVHLSRLAEDVILFSSDEFGFLELPDSLATGSSRMPHKKNPDVLELVRGNAARAIGDLAGLLSLLKGLPLSYNKDLQLDKEPVFRLHRTLGLALPVLTDLVEKLRLDRNRMCRMAAQDNFLATELTDILAARGIPFRQAHEIVGRRYAEARRAGKTLVEHGPAGKIAAGDLAALRVEKILAKKRAWGGTAPARVKEAAQAARKRIQKLRRRP